MLRQRLMCTADTGLLPFIWSYTPDNSGVPHVFTDFNREYKCRNFDAIRVWAGKHQADWEGTLDIEPSPGDKIFPEVP